MVSQEKAGFFVIRANEDGVNVIGLTRGKETKFNHLEKLDRGEMMIAQFTEHTSAVKVRGDATVLTPYGKLDSLNQEETDSNRS